MSDRVPLLDRIWRASVLVLAIALVLTWAWALLRPLLPIIAGVLMAGLALLALVRAALRRREYW